MNSSEPRSWRPHRRACSAGTDSRPDSRELGLHRDSEENPARGWRMLSQPLCSLPASLMPEPACTVPCQDSKLSGQAIRTSDTSAKPIQTSPQRPEAVWPEVGRFPDNASLYRRGNLREISAGTFSTRQSPIRTASDSGIRRPPQIAACPVQYLPP